MCVADVLSMLAATKQLHVNCMARQESCKAVAKILACSNKSQEWRTCRVWDIDEAHATRKDGDVPFEPEATYLPEIRILNRKWHDFVASSLNGSVILCGAGAERCVADVLSVLAAARRSKGCPRIFACSYGRCRKMQTNGKQDSSTKIALCKLTHSY